MLKQKAKQTIVFVLLTIFPSIIFARQKYTVYSPDNKLTAEVTVDSLLMLAVSYDNKPVLYPSSIGMDLKNDIRLGKNPTVRRVSRRIINDKFETPVYKKSNIDIQGNEITIKFTKDFSLIVRCYNDGAAYRFVTHKKDSVIIQKEIANYHFADQSKGYIAYSNQKDITTIENQFFNSFENTYDVKKLIDIPNDRLIITPFLATDDSGLHICMLETDIYDYPGMFLKKDSEDKALFQGVHATYPKKIEQGGHNLLQGIVVEREAYIAKTIGSRSFPWRIFVVAQNDEQLLNNDLAYALSQPSEIEQTNWIRPGKVAWEWWNAWNLEKVDFKTGINNSTYKYYIDFASKNGIEYIILDEGWSVNKKADLMQVVPDIDLQELIKYGKERQVDIILWAGYWAYMRDMEKITEHYAKMGIKGFKIDFLDRDDQPMINFMWKTAKLCAQHKMLVDFHGCSKPFGLQRTYPNVINFEAVNGLEQLKWKPKEYDQVTYDVTFPFIRMLAGCVDYTQGAMRNAAQSCYQPIRTNPMSQGTRCRQLASYVVFESPLNMLCDSPTNYEKEQECTDFITAIPTVWDQTQVMPSKITQYISIARRKDDVWYVGAMNDWNKRTLELDMSFLEEGDYQMTIFKDGINAHRIGTDYSKINYLVPANRKVLIELAPGGGWVAKIEKLKAQ
ncbi:MAG: glycoside hydrolase family 97 protein [Bacteroidales bacterium]